MKLSKLFLVAVCAVAFLACNTTPSPTEVFKQQTEAQQKKDAATMKQNLSKGSLDLIEKVAKTQNKTLDEALTMDDPMTANQANGYETRNEKINGDVATLEVKTSKDDQWATVPFVKEDGKWKIAFDKLLESGGK